MAGEGKFGARVFLMEGKVYVVQTVKRGTTHHAPYVIDGKGRQKNSGSFADIADDKAIADAVRAALHGTLLRMPVSGKSVRQPL